MIYAAEREEKSEPFEMNGWSHAAESDFLSRSSIADGLGGVKVTDFALIMRCKMHIRV